MTTAGDSVANRDTWHVDHVPGDGSLVVSRIHGQGTVTLPPDYVQSQVRLGYATTAYGHQGDTVDVSYTLVSTSSTHQGLYVGATRGRTDNRLMVVTDEPDLAHARDVLDYALSRDRADVPAIAQRRELAAQAAPSQPDDFQSRERRLAELDRAATKAVLDLRPFEGAFDEAERKLARARVALAELERQQKAAGRFRRRHFDTPIAEAQEAVTTAKAALVDTEVAMEPAKTKRDQACYERDQLRRQLKTEQIRRELNDTERRPVQRDAPGLGL